MRKIWIFGAGRNGKKAIYYLRMNGYKDAVEGVIDNAKNKLGITFLDKTITPFADVKGRISSDDLIIITPDMAVAPKIAKQISDAGFVRYLYWVGIDGLDFQVMRKLIEEPNEYKVQAFSLEQEKNLYYNQAQFLIDHINANTMKPATGELREHQLKLVQFAKDFFDAVSSTGIRPFLEGGNLLGHIRHNGFIPWDDDLDFTLLRGDFEKLSDYCRNNMDYRVYNGPTDNNSIYKWVNDQLKECIDKMVLIETPLRLRVHMGTGKEMWTDQPFIDLIPLDEYKTDIDYKEHIEFLDSIINRLINMESASEQRQFIKEMYEYDVTNHQSNGGHFCYGLDSLEGYYNRNKVWHRKENIFPLQIIDYEGAEFWVPHDPTEYLKAEFGESLMELPGNACLEVHRKSN